MQLAALEKVEISGKLSGELKQALTAVVEDVVIYLPLAGLIDLGQEISRLEKELAKLEKEIARSGAS